MKKILIAAVSKNNVIGKAGKVPWHSKEELQYFKNITMGSPVLMGRKTWESVGKPLPGRLNIVVTNNKDYTSYFKEVVIFYSLQQALNYCATSSFDKVYIIGGGQIYEQSINHADELMISEMNFESEGDTYFPETDLSDWQLESDELFTDFTVHHYIRREKK